MTTNRADRDEFGRDSEGYLADGSRMFISSSPEPKVTGSRHWDTLSIAEQDELLLASFVAEPEWKKVVTRIDVFDAVAFSIRDHLCESVRDVGVGAKASEVQRQNFQRSFSAYRLRGTPLGNCLSRALGRQRPDAEQTPDMQLVFYSLRPGLPIPGWDGLHESSFGGFDTLLGMRVNLDSDFDEDLDEDDEDDVGDCRPHSDIDRALPLTLRSERCSHCREALGSKGRFCPNCGKPRLLDQTPVTGASHHSGAIASSAKLAAPSYVYSLPLVVAVLMLVWALVPSNPYGYYRILRWVVSGASLLLAEAATEEGFDKIGLLMLATVILYNPIFRIPLDRDTWSVINVATVALFLVFAQRSKSIRLPWKNVGRAPRVRS